MSPEPHAERKDPIIVLSTQDYHDLWTRKQRFAAEFARLGHRVLYVESQWHLLTYVRNLRSQWRRIVRWLLPPKEIETNLFVVTPPVVLPLGQVWSPIAAVNGFIIGLWLRRVAGALEMNRPLIYTYVPYSHVTIKLLGADRVLYEKVDDLAAARGLVRRSTVDRLETRLLKTADLVIVTAARLKKKLLGRHDNVHIIPNGCETQHFQRGVGCSGLPSAITSLVEPRIGFVGALAYWIDLDLIEYLARRRPHWSFVFIGPSHCSVEQLAECPNIHFLGRVPYDDLPDYMAGINVFINPYKLDDIAASCSPLKMFEYLAAGKPVVSVPMPEVMRFAPHVRIAASYSEFLCRIEELLGMSLKERLELSRTLQSLVSGDTWENRFNRTRTAIAETFEP